MNSLSPIKGFEGKYAVTKDGRVWSYPRFSPCGSWGGVRKWGNKFLKTSVSRSGYEYLALIDQGRPKHKKIHRLVAEAFIPNPKALPEINHIDGNKFNNRVSNLEWCTRSHNISHAFKIGLQDSKRIADWNRKLTPAKARKIKIRLAEGLYQKDISKEFDISQSVISAIKLGLIWKGI